MNHHLGNGPRLGRLLRRGSRRRAIAETGKHRTRRTLGSRLVDAAPAVAIAAAFASADPDVHRFGGAEGIGLSRRRRRGFRSRPRSSAAASSARDDVSIALPPARRLTAEFRRHLFPHDDDTLGALHRRRRGFALGQRLERCRE